jgi:hypothetical protein
MVQAAEEFEVFDGSAAVSQKKSFPDRIAHELPDALVSGKRGTKY